jgi:hypothetical protein
MMSNFYKYIILLVLVLFILSGCISKEDDNIKDDEVTNIEELTETEKENPNEMENNTEDNFYEKYIKLAEYLEKNVDLPELTEEEKLIKEKYFKLLSVPENIYELDYDLEFIKRIDFDEENGLPGWYVGEATEEHHPSLHMVTENGDLCFTPSGWGYSSKYLVDKDEWIRYEVGDYYCPEFIKIESIIYEGEWRKIIFDKYPDRNIYVDYNNEKIQIGNYNDFPINYNGAYLIKPIENNISIWKTYYNVIHLNKRQKSTDKGFLYYDLENNQTIEEYILAGTDKYETFRDITPVRTIDSKGRIYMNLHDQPYNDNRNGHVMILDLENDALYNIHHPYYTEINENDDGFIVIYVLGEDDNIYFQLITDKAYYIYKITPLWDSIEETEYNPRFIEYYPELQEVWDGL